MSFSPAGFTPASPCCFSLTYLTCISDIFDTFNIFYTFDTFDIFYTFNTFDIFYTFDTFDIFEKFDTFEISSSWIHPWVSQLLLSLDQFDTIRYAAYRLSTKLLTVQQVPVTHVLNGLRFKKKCEDFIEFIIAGPRHLTDPSRFGPVSPLPPRPL